MNPARDDILDRIRSAKAGALGPPHIPRDPRRASELARDELVALFCERVRDYRAEIQQVSAHRLPGAILAAASAHGARRLAVPAGLPVAWRPPELELITDRSLTPRELDGLDGVITGATIAIAETGTIVLSAGPDEGRRILSLVPDLHICIVHAAQVVGGVAEAIARLAETTRQDARPITLISGPSATSDIELQRVEGVHGPRRLVVLLIQDSLVDSHSGVAVDEA